MNEKNVIKVERVVREAGGDLRRTYSIDDSGLRSPTKHQDPPGGLV